MNKIEAVNRSELYKWVVDRLSEYKDTQLLSSEIKKYVPKKTRKQLGLLFEAIEYFIQARDGFVSLYVNETDKKLVYQGIVEKYGYKQPTGFTVKNGYGEEVRQLVPIPLSEVNRLEQFEVIFEGLFIEARSQGIDMSGFVNQWEQIKQKEREKNESQTIKG